MGRLSGVANRTSGRHHPATRFLGADLALMTDNVPSDVTTNVGWDEAASDSFRRSSKLQRTHNNDSLSEVSADDVDTDIKR